MALLRGSVIMGAYTMPSRDKIAQTGVQFCKAPWWSKKPFYLRNPPHTIENPHKGQVQTRVKFGKAAKTGAEDGFKEGMPATAANVKSSMDGYRAPAAMAEADYPSKTRRTAHTLEELEKML